MNKTLQTSIIVIVVLIGAVVLAGAGFFLGRSAFGWNSYYPGGMMGNFNQSDQDSQFGYGMMGPGMMNGYGYMQDDGKQYPSDNGMMEGYGGYGMMGPGMMGGFGATTNTDPLTVDESLEAVEAYLSTLGNEDLSVAEIMVFDNNSYAIVKEEGTGIGAFELLIDPATKDVFPEYGPNMMWNLKYGMHAGGFGGMMGSGMMGGGYMGGDMMGPDSSDGDMMGATSNSDLDNNSGDLLEISAEMTVSEDEAQAFAQTYLDTFEPGVKVSHEVTAFYGYYTIDLEKDGDIVGMLSVNGYTGQVFPHWWHGAFIDMVEYDHE